MAIQNFTAGQVLTAAQMNSLQANDYNWTVSTKTASYVLVAADKGTRVVMNSASATTITVNTSLFSAGDTLFLQNIGAGVCTVTAGTATVSSAGPLAIPQYGSGILYFTSPSVAIYFPSAVTASSSPILAIGTNSVATSQSTTSTTYADLATVGPTVTLTTGTSALVTLYAQFVCNESQPSIGIEVSGATTISPNKTTSGVYMDTVVGAYYQFMTKTYQVTLTAGSNTFKMKYLTTTNAFTVFQRFLQVIAL